MTGVARDRRVGESRPDLPRRRCHDRPARARPPGTRTRARYDLPTDQQLRTDTTCDRRRTPGSTAAIRVRAVRDRRSEGDGSGRHGGRGPTCRPVGLPQLCDAAGDIRLLDPRVGLSRGTRVERPRRPQRASARDHARLQELRRLRAMELSRLGHDEGRRVAPQQRLEVRLHHVLPEGQDERDLLRRTSRGISGTSVARPRPRSTPAA